MRGGAGVEGARYIVLSAEHRGTGTGYGDGVRAGARQKGTKRDDDARPRRTLKPAPTLIPFPIPNSSPDSLFPSPDSLLPSPSSVSVLALPCTKPLPPSPLPPDL